MVGERTYKLHVVRGDWVFSNIQFALGHLADHEISLEEDSAEDMSREEDRS
jgi:hypothetical protein